MTYKLNHGFIPINIYIDLSKASDTLTHSILLDKLSYYGVNGVAKNLLQSYLSHSHQVVDFLVVPQGFVLGSSLFSENINELPSCTDIFNMIMYADDTTLFCDINGNPADEHVLNTELCKITDWLSANKLPQNVNKTKCIVFHSDKKKVLHPKLFIDAIEIERVDYFNVLGLQLNHTLKWNKQ